MEPLGLCLQLRTERVSVLQVKENEFLSSFHYHIKKSCAPKVKNISKSANIFLQTFGFTTFS